MNEIKDIHEPLAAFLNKNRIPFHRNRPDKKTTAIKGDPDFLCTFCNRCLYIECKVPTGVISKAQKERIAYLRQAGNTVIIAYSCAEAISAVQTWLGVINAAGEAVERENEPSLPVRDAEHVLGASPKAKTTAWPLKIPNLFIGNIGGKNYVLSGNPEPGGSATRVRLATAADLINIRGTA